jgi:hypothetical protein
MRACAAEALFNPHMERRKTPRKEWVIAKDDVGRSVLEWKLDPMRAKRMESDPCARTYDFLNRLDHPELAIEDDGKEQAPPPAFNPYDHGAGTSPRKKRSS